jgi:serine protease Do
MEKPFRPCSFVDSRAVKKGFRPFSWLGVVAFCVVPGLAGAQPAPPAQLPPKPGAKAPAKPAEKKVEAGGTPAERALRGVVSVERSGQTLALGAVLGGDGRVLTALSPLGPGNDLDVRFADGSTARAKLGHHDRTWDLALLVPQTGRWPQGLIASSREPVRPDGNSHSFTYNKGKIAPAHIILRSRRTLLGGDDRQLENAIEIGSRVSPGDLGTPIIDEEGRVLAILGRGCAPNENRACTPVAFGAPISAVKNFLRTVPPTAVQPAAWLGIQGVAENNAVVKGVRILVVHPESPADEAQLKGGDRNTSDVILAVDGVPVATPEALSAAIRTHGVGVKVPLQLYSGGKYKMVSVLLRAAPDPRKSPQAPANPAELPTNDPNQGQRPKLQPRTR